MDYATVILWRRSGNINHSKDNLRLFLKTKEVIRIFSLYSTVPRHSPYRYFYGYHESPQCSVFPLPIYYLLSPHSIIFFLSILLPTPPGSQIAAIHPVPNSLLPLSLPLQLGHICSQIHFTIFPKALPCFQHCWNACARKAAATGNSPPSVAWFRAIAGSKKTSASTAIQTLFPLVFLFQTAVEWHK